MNKIEISPRLVLSLVLLLCSALLERSTGGGDREGVHRLRVLAGRRGGGGRGREDA